MLLHQQLYQYHKIEQGLSGKKLNQLKDKIRKQNEREVRTTYFNDNILIALIQTNPESLIENSKRRICNSIAISDLPKKIKKTISDLIILEKINKKNQSVF